MTLPLAWHSLVHRRSSLQALNAALEQQVPISFLEKLNLLLLLDHGLFAAAHGLRATQAWWRCIAIDDSVAGHFVILSG
jgi:hypothetical protein